MKIKRLSGLVFVAGIAGSTARLAVVLLLIAFLLGAATYYLLNLNAPGICLPTNSATSLDNCMKPAQTPYGLTP